jgi:4-carboxymuconolactone decarboxylase
MSDEQPIRRLEREKRPAPAEWFTGHVEIESVFIDKESKTAHGRVHFHDGARTNWHLHTGDQVLYFVSGVGMAQNHDGPVFECVPGDIVHVPPGTRHIHGAMPGQDATHIAITQGDHVWENEPNYPRPS